MIKWILTALLFSGIATLNSAAQDETRGQKSTPIISNTAQKSMLVIPMMDKMFLSNVSGQLGKANELSYKELKELLVEKINETAVLSASGVWQAEDASAANDSLTTIFHQATAFKYDLVLVHSQKEETKIQEFWQKLQEKSQTLNSEKNGAYLEKGEVKEFYDNKERFMNAQLDTAFISSDYFQNIEQDYVLIINELDITKPNPNDVNYNTGERTLKLHFTLYSSAGKHIYGNATFATFDKGELDIYSIINSSLFSAVNRMIAECSAHLKLISPKLEEE